MSTDPTSADPGAVDYVATPPVADAPPVPAQNGYLSREAILSTEDIITEDVDVPEWGGKVRVKSMTGLERDAFDASLTTGVGKDLKINTDNMRARLVAATCVDDLGALVFTPEDVAALGQHSGAALGRVSLVAQKLNGLTGADVEAMVESLGKGQSAGPGSA